MSSTRFTERWPITVLSETSNPNASLRRDRTGPRSLSVAQLPHVGTDDSEIDCPEWLKLRGTLAFYYRTMGSCYL